MPRRHGTFEPGALIAGQAGDPSPSLSPPVKHHLRPTAHWPLGPYQSPSSVRPIPRSLVRGRASPAAYRDPLSRLLPIDPRLVGPLVDVAHHPPSRAPS